MMNWCDRKGDNTDVIIMSRIRVMRNIKGFPFPVKMNEEEKETVNGMVRQAACELGMHYARADELDDKAKKELYEQYLAEDYIGRAEDRTALLISKDDDISIVVNKEEHIELNACVPGSNIGDAFAKVENIAARLERKMDIAFSDRLGFLTSGIANVGTGLRIYSIVSLPAVEKTAGALNVLMKRLEKYDWTIAPMTFSTGGKVQGFYRIFNTSTLGVTEEEVLSKANKVMADVIKLEHICRHNIHKKKAGMVEDQFFRAYGILKYARRLDVEELYGLLNWLRMCHGIIKKKDDIELDWDMINRLTHSVCRSYDELQVAGKNTPQIAKNRAERIRMILKGDEKR